eukprot:1736832-Rhodomonas_salina.1
MSAAIPIEETCWTPAQFKGSICWRPLPSPHHRTPKRPVDQVQRAQLVVHSRLTHGALRAGKATEEPFFRLRGVVAL